VGSVVVLLVSSLALVALLAAMSIGVTWWAVFGDKARHRRCPRCWHDLSGTPGMTCGECGFAARSERDLLRTRRRWGIAAVSVTAILVVAGWTRVELLDGSWTAQVPDAVIVRIPAMLPSSLVPRWAWDELADRLSAEALRPDDVLAAIDACIATDGPRGSPEDQASRVLAIASWGMPQALRAPAGETITASEARERARQAFESARERRLAAVPSWVEVVPPARWPAGTPPIARVRGTAWGDAEWRVRIEGGGGPWLVGNGRAAFRMQPRAAALELPSPDADGRVRTRIAVEERRRPTPSAPWGAWTPLRELPIDAAITPADVERLHADDSPALAEAARTAFDLPVAALTDANRMVGLHFDLRAFAGAASGDLLVGAVIELLEDGVARRRSRVWWPASASERAGWDIELEDLDALGRIRRLAEDPDRLPPAPEGGSFVPGWTMRITGDRTVALRAADPARLGLDTLRTWSGQTEFPLRVSGLPLEVPTRSYRIER
jgi:hypothetical protein